MKRPVPLKWKTSLSPHKSETKYIHFPDKKNSAELSLFIISVFIIISPFSLCVERMGVYNRGMWCVCVQVRLVKRRGNQRLAFDKAAKAQTSISPTGMKSPKCYILLKIWNAKRCESQNILNLYQEGNLIINAVLSTLGKIRKCLSQCK